MLLKIVSFWKNNLTSWNE